METEFSFDTVSFGSFLNLIFSVIEPIIKIRVIGLYIKVFAKPTTNYIKTSTFNYFNQGSTDRFKPQFVSFGQDLGSYLAFFMGNHSTLDTMNLFKKLHIFKSVCSK